MRALDDALPHFDVNEVHSISLPCSAERAVELALAAATETRVQAVDDRARRALRRYWLVVGPFSGLIGRRWPRAVERACP